MAIVIYLALGLHVLSATFWAGSTFTLARNAGKGAAELFGAQMDAAAVTVVAGAYLWAQMFGTSGGHTVLGLGALAAVIAAIVQALVVGRVRTAIDQEERARARAALGHRIAAGLLAITVLCMVFQ